MKIAIIVATAVMLTLTTAPLYGDKIRIAAWDIAHLRDQNFEGPNPRSDYDYERLARYAALINADVVALQEVEGPSAAERIFSSNEYAFYFSSSYHTTKTGFAVRKDLTVFQNPDYQDLNVDGGQRYGTDITLQVNGQEVRMLSVHLQTGCWQDDIYATIEPCVILNQQMHRLEEWIDQRASDGVPFIILGDFNRKFDAPGDAFWTEIDDSSPPNADLSRVTEGLNSNCWLGRFSPEYLDHIVLGQQATEFLVPDSFQQIVYTEGIDFIEVLSDHCPLSVELDIQLPLSSPSAPTTFHVVD